MKSTAPAMESEFAFDLSLRASIRFKAKSEQHAINLIQTRFDAVETSFGDWANGQTVTGEVSWNGGGVYCHEKDGVTVINPRPALPTYALKECNDPKQYQLLDLAGEVVGFLKRGTGGIAERAACKRRADKIVAILNAEDELVLLLRQVVARVNMANSEGNPIMSALLPEAEKLLATITN